MSNSATQVNDPRPLIVHVIYRLQVGGLENGVVNLVNHLPEERFRNAIVCLTEYTGFRQRIERNDIEVYAMEKQPGQDFGSWKRLYQLFRRLKPAIVHTRNLGCMEAQIPAWLARVPCRIHGEHGWDVTDPNGDVRKYQLLRRLHAPLIQRFIPLSRELEAYLVQRAGISAKKMTRIYNGVDTSRFHPGHSTALPEHFCANNGIVFGTAGRMHGVKDQLNLTRAFVQLREQLPEMADRLRLVLIGDGPLRAECLALLQQADAQDQAWLPGARNDIPELMRALDVYVLPSQTEGLSNTILEAMACGLPVIATRVGGNVELVKQDGNGLLVAPGNPGEMAQAMRRYAQDRSLRERHGQAGLARIQQHFSLGRMVGAYTAVYDQLLQQQGIIS